MAVDDALLTAERLQEFMACLSFEKVGGKFDTLIRGLGLDHAVSDIATTKLKEARISKAIPTVAECTRPLITRTGLRKRSSDGI